MTTRIMTFHYHGASADEERMMPVYYIEGDYTPVAVRIYAETAPSTGDALIDIFDDGVSIFSNRSSRTISSATATRGLRTTVTAVTAAALGEGFNAEEYAEDFPKSLVIEQGSWVSCNLVNAYAGEDFTVHLELERISEDGEEEY